MTAAVNPSELRELFDNTRQLLLSQRGDHGHWEGELSSSALSTATAVIAFDLSIQSGSPSEPAPNAEKLAAMIARGLDWLLSTQNEDGGWGDTVLSKSNISTTALVWAALAGRDEVHREPEALARNAKTEGLASASGFLGSPQPPRYAEAMRRCEAWLERAAGSLEPRVLAKAIADRYGKDRTFSVPILTTLALRGRLGNVAAAWQLVPQLPFELAAFPHRWYAVLKLPVVSYALPALIAIGQLKHQLAPSWNPVFRVARNLTRGRTLRVLESIQPASGGFLEATPLTSFVVLSLIGAGNGRHPVVKKGIEFLIRSVRADGSWPIDTNLATWVTTLAVNALSTADALPVADESKRIRDWLSNQQYREVHPYTNAAPGAWAWTNLTGGVPDADDTPGALLALWHLAGPAAAKSAEAGVKWLLDLQNSDGGMPTFCKGWGVLPFDRSSADLTAHALRAWSTWSDHCPQLEDRIVRAVFRGLEFLKRIQRPDGAWAPLWFGNQHAATEENLTYGTSRVLLAWGTIGLPADFQGGIDWLVTHQNAEGGWGSGEGTPSSIEETALAVEALCVCVSQVKNRGPLRDAVQRGLRWLIEHTNCGREFPPSPIGFYFAKLWYYEKLYPMVYTLAAAGRALKLNDDALLGLQRDDAP